MLMEAAARTARRVRQMEDAQADELMRALVHRSFMVWWEVFSRILNKDREETCPVANAMQEKIAEAIQYCLDQGLPIRILNYKIRQCGSSTIFDAFCYWMMRVHGINALICGGQYSQVENLWEIFTYYFDTDEYDWGFGGRVLARNAAFENLAALGQETAGDKSAGRSDTIQGLVCTEVAYWAEGGVKDASDVLRGLLKCVPFRPLTFVILESTASGGTGLFADRWNLATHFEAFKRGQRAPDGFIRIFTGWWEFQENRLPCENESERQGILRGEGARSEEQRQRERDLRARYKLDAEQIKWWRLALSEAKYDIEAVDMECPASPEDGFKATSRCRFNTSSLRLMRDEAVRAQAIVKRVILEQPNVHEEVYSARIVSGDEDAEYLVFEWPVAGRRYTISVDNARGLATGDDEHDTDCHAVMVIREGYFRDLSDGRRQWVRPSVVACIKPHQRVDVIGILSEWVFRLYKFYGCPLVVPEANNDGGLIETLRGRGVRLYEQEKPATHKESRKKTGKFGFWMSGQDGEGNRRAIIEALAAQIREVTASGDGLFIPFTHILDELETFRVNPKNGKAEAMSGKHDDWVMALAIGMFQRGAGTVYVQPLLKEEGAEERFQNMAARRGERGLVTGGSHRV